MYFSMEIPFNMRTMSYLDPWLSKAKCKNALPLLFDLVVPWTPHQNVIRYCPYC